jgi:ABC-2 type transport system ATP-binding protein
MANHPLMQYIEEARQRGMTSKQISQALTTAGWHVHEVLDIMLDRVSDLHLPPSPGVDIGDQIISVRNVSKSYGKVKALDNVSLDVQRGSVTALLGPNGAGKTTLIRILTTLLSHDHGQIHIAGYRLPQNAQELRSVIGLAGQNAAVDETLTGRENLDMVGRLYHFDSRTAKLRSAELLTQFDLLDAADRTTRTYSGGMRRRLDLAASLVSKPKILFLDEPTTGLDPRSRFALWHVIRQLVEDGTTVLLTTQYLEEADQLAHQIFVIDHGHIIAQGTPDELKRQVGGEVLELHMVNHQDSSRSAEIIKKFGSEEPRINPDSNIITMSVKGDASILVDVVRQLDEANLKIADIVLRRPSLDDVFMKLTGHSTTEQQYV